MTYSIDTNACIDAWREFYPYSVFPKVWDGWLTSLFEKGELVMSRSVFEELEVGGDDLFQWVKKIIATAVKEDNEVVQAQVIKLQAEWPVKETDFQRRLKGADLFVIGHVRKDGGIVVSHEQKSGSMRDPKIPDACEHLDIECIRIAEMFRREGFSF